ncbi:MAG: hypothetical protein K6T94_12120 [Paenibacillus sp.]|nr:hypothetical protein [Paenibacillus sp.]
MDWTRRGLSLFSLFICSSMLAVAITPQHADASSESAKLSNIKEVIASAGFWGGSSFALGKEGSVWAWGSNYSGQFANGTAGPEGWTITPHRLTALEHTKQIVIGYGYNMALKEDGTVTVWGGFKKETTEEPGTQNKVLLPQSIGGLTEVVQITAGVSGSLALKKDGSLMQWEMPETSSVGYPTLPSAFKVNGITDVQRIESGMFNAALKENGTLWIWNGNSNSTPIPVPNLYHVKTMDVEGDSLIALTDSGSVWATVGDWSTPSGISIRKMTGLTGIVSIQTGNGLNLVQNRKGEYWIWKSGTPLQGLQKITALRGLSKLTLDLNGLVGIKKDGTVWSWRQNYTTEKLTFIVPKQIKGLQSPLSFATGEDSKYAVLKNGTVAAWGTNMFGQLGISALDSRPFTPSPVLKPVDLLVNGKSIDSVQPPIFKDGYVLVPIRPVAEELGYSVIWDGSTKLIKDGKSSILIKNDQISIEGGPSYVLKQPSLEVSYTLLVPINALSKVMGISAKWDSDRYQLTLE